VKVCTIGTGYVGLSTAICLAYLGHEVRGFDIDKRKIASLQRSTLPIYEPGLQALLGLVKEKITFVDDPALALCDAEVIFITVGTPSLADGRPDLRYLQSAAEIIGKHRTENFAVIVTKSTVPIGTNDYLEHLVRQSYRISYSESEQRFAIAYNPEFLRQGSAIHDSLYPDRIVVGSNSVRALETLSGLYRPIIDQTFEAPRFLPRPDNLRRVPLVTAALTSTEIIKYAANAFLALKISFANELAELSECVNADISQIVHGIGIDRRIGQQFLQAGLGWGGSCFGKDTAALIETARDYGVEMRIVRAARDVNYRQRERVIEKLTRELGSLGGKVVGLLGLAFKPHTDDLRDGPSLDIGRRLLERGARVRAHDPVALPRARVECHTASIQLCESLDQLAKGAHALVLVTEWPEYGTLRWEGLGSTMRNRFILDARNFLDRKELESVGFRYVGIGGRDRLFTEGADASTRAMVRGSISARETVFSRRTVSEMFSQSLRLSG